MISIIFSDDPTLNKRINRIIAIMTIVGFLGAGSLWTYHNIWPWAEQIATEQEAAAMDIESMNQHKAENSLEEWADKNDVIHIANLLVEGQLEQVNADIAWYLDAAIERNKTGGSLTVGEAKILGRLEERKQQLLKSFTPEPGELHSHGE